MFFSFLFCLIFVSLRKTSNTIEYETYIMYFMSLIGIRDNGAE